MFLPQLIVNLNRIVKLQWQSIEILLDPFSAYCTPTLNREISSRELYFCDREMQIYIPEYFDVAAACVHARACLFVALAFSAFLCSHFCSGTSRTPHERMPLFYEIVNVESVRQFWPRRAYTRRNTSLFMFQFLFDCGFRRCSIVKSWLKFR